MTGGKMTLLIVMLNGTRMEVPASLVAVSSNVNKPETVGVPDMMPVLLIVRPPGRAPDATAQLVGAPEATIAKV